MIFRFVGTELETAEASLKWFGQSVELTEQRAAEIITRGAILPAKIFDSIGFTEQELKAYRGVGSHADATDEFKAKKHAALLAVHALRERIADGHGFEEE